MKKKRFDASDPQTILSLERTIMSKEKVALAEISVLIGLMALGFGLIALFEKTNSHIYWIGVSFLGLSIVGILLAYLNYQQYKKKLQAIEDGNDFKIRRK